MDTEAARFLILVLARFVVIASLEKTTTNNKQTNKQTNKLSNLFYFIIIKLSDTGICQRDCPVI